MFLQTFTAPATGTYVFTVAGGQGGSSPAAVGGLGATVIATVFLNSGATVPIVVAGQGVNSNDQLYSNQDGSGGGGLSAVYTADTTLPTIVAGMLSALLLRRVPCG